MGNRETGGEGEVVKGGKKNHLVLVWRLGVREMNSNHGLPGFILKGSGLVGSWAWERVKRVGSGLVVLDWIWFWYFGFI